MRILHFMGLVAILAVASIAASIAGCSAAPPPSTFGSTDPGSSGGSSGAGGSGGSSSGADASSGTGSSGGNDQSGGSSSSTSSGGSNGSSSGSSSGDAGPALPTRGCGQATSCTPADDLAPPAAADGFQIATPDNAFTIRPNTEAYYCYFKLIPGNAAINVGAFQSWMTPGASHHFILFTGNNGADNTVSGGVVSGGAGVGCVPQGSWVYATSTAGEIIELKMPDGVGLPMPAGQMFIFNIHLINTGTTAISPKIKLNVLYAKNATATAGAMVSFNAGIAVQPGATQDVTGSCSPPAGSKFFAFTTHVHRHGGSTATGAFTDVNLMRGGTKTNLVHSTDWESPDVALWSAPNYLTVQSGDQFQYDCHFVNKDATLVTFGETAATGEMCMSIGYYFPATVQTQGTLNPYCN